MLLSVNVFHNDNSEFIYRKNVYITDTLLTLNQFSVSIHFDFLFLTPKKPFQLTQFKQSLYLYSYQIEKSTASMC